MFSLHIINVIPRKSFPHFMVRETHAAVNYTISRSGHKHNLFVTWSEASKEGTLETLWLSTCLGPPLTVSIVWLYDF